jgi:rRNA maturation endonuclease Nob1
MNYCESCGARLLKNPDDDLCDGCYASIADEKADAVCHFCGESADAEINGVFVCEGRQCYNDALMKQEV